MLPHGRGSVNSSLRLLGICRIRARPQRDCTLVSKDGRPGGTFDGQAINVAAERGSVDALALEPLVQRGGLAESDEFEAALPAFARCE